MRELHILSLILIADSLHCDAPREEEIILFSSSKQCILFIVVGGEAGPGCVIFYTGLSLFSIDNQINLENYQWKCLLDIGWISVV